jgi:hypothetical protein
MANLSAVRDLYDGLKISYVLEYSNNNRIALKTLYQNIALLDINTQLFIVSVGSSIPLKDLTKDR